MAATPGYISPINIPASVATLLGTQSLSNKTLVSPILSGNPTAPTASLGDNTTKIATTAFVLANLPVSYFTLSQYSGTGTTSGDPLTIANLSGAVISSGTIADARQSSNIPLKNGTNSFSGVNTFTSAVTMSASGNSFGDSTMNNITVNGGINCMNIPSEWGYYCASGAKLYNLGYVFIGNANTTITSCIFAVAASDKGSIPAPKLTTTQRDAISGPVEGLMVVNTTTHRLNMHDGTSWQDISSIPTQVVEVTGTTQAMLPNVKYIANNAARVVFTLPATFKQGDNFYIRGKGAGGWRISQNASQIIHGATDTTSGTGGYIQSQATYDTLALEGITLNTDLIIISKNGTLTTA